MDALLANKVALVTGAAAGIGREIAYAYSAAGARVVVSDVDERGGGETVAHIRERRGEAIFVRADTSSPADNAALVAKAVETWGGLHVACNNAGISGPLVALGDYPVEDWNRVIAVNLSGVFYGMRAQIPAILRSGGGAIVSIGSILSQVGFPGSAAYAAAKHGLVGLTQTATIDYAGKNIRFNVVGPAVIRTQMVEKALSPDALRAVSAQHPIGRIGEPAEVAQLVLWLSSDRASFVTGAYYPIDGGFLAQ